MALRPPIPRTSAYSSVICDHRYDEAKSGDGGYRVVGVAYNDVSSPEVPVGGVKQRAAQSGSKIEDRQLPLRQCPRRGRRLWDRQ
jgi:hypothetical protein